MGSSSLLADQQATLPDSQEIRTNGDAEPEDSPMDAEQSDSTDSDMENDDIPTEDGGHPVCVCVRASAHLCVVRITAGPLMLQSQERVCQTCCSVSSVEREVTLTHSSAPDASAP